MTSAYSLLSGTRHVALHSCKGAEERTFVVCSDREKQGQITMSTSDVCLRQANDLALLQTVVPQILGKRNLEKRLNAVEC